MADRVEGYKPLGDTSVLVVEDCSATIQPFGVPDSSRLQISKVECSGCVASDAGAKQRLFAVRLNAPDGDVSDPYVARFLGPNCAIQPPSSPSDRVEPLSVHYS